MGLLKISYTTSRGGHRILPTLLTGLELAMIKKRSRPQTRVREISPEVEEAHNTEVGEAGGEERLE